MNGELQSDEALTLKRVIHSIGTNVLRAVQEAKSATEEGFAEQAEAMGKLLGELGDVKHDVRDVKRVLGLDGDHLVKVPRPEPHRPHRRPNGDASAPPVSERPSIPPRFVEEKGISITDTGSYRVDPLTLERLSRRMSDFEEKEKHANAVAEGAKALRDDLEAKNKKLSERITFIMAVGGGVIALIGAVATAIVWTAQHVH